MAVNTRIDMGQVLTTSVAKRSKKVQDIIYKATPITRILLDSKRIKEYRAGGPEIRIPVEFDRLDAQWFTGYDKIDITPKELVNSAVWNWARVVSPFSLNGTELLYNAGPERQLDLMEFYINAAEKSAKETFELALVGDGTANGGRQLIGLGGAVPITPNVGIYGGIDRANVANWRTSTFNIPNGDVPGYTTWDSTTCLDIVNDIVARRSRGNNYAKILMCDLNSYRAINQASMSHVRIVSERLAKLGFSGITLTTPAGPVDVYCAAGIGTVMPANTIFGIDEESLALYTFPGENFVPFHPGGGLRPINQDAVAQGITWSGQLVLENPLFTFRIVTA